MPTQSMAGKPWILPEGIKTCDVLAGSLRCLQCLAVQALGTEELLALQRGWAARLGASELTFWKPLQSVS